MTGRTKLDAHSKVGRALFQLVDSSAKMSVEIRTRVVRVRNLVESAPDDPMTRYKIDSDLGFLLKESRLNPHVLALRKAMPK